MYCGVRLCIDSYILNYIEYVVLVIDLCAYMFLKVFAKQLFSCMNCSLYEPIPKQNIYGNFLYSTTTQ